VIDKLEISPEDKNRLKEYRRFIFFYNSTNEISDYKMSTMKKLLHDKGLYSQKINELMNESRNRPFNYLKSQLPWNDTRTRIDTLHKQLKDQVDGILQEGYSG
jgi:hypothetical protein